MAQDRNEINGTAEIKSEIERTRIEMRETIGEIQDRLRPDHLLQQAKDGVTEAAAGKVRNIMRSTGETAQAVAEQARGIGSHLAWYAREHPIRMAITAGALTWWMLRGRNRPGDWAGASEASWERDGTSPDDDTDPAYTSGTDGSLRDKVGEYASSARETAGEYASSARETAAEYAESARSTARRASEGVRTAATAASARAQQRLRQASASADRFVHENPLAAGAVALAAGVAIGLSVPATELENRTMGEARDTAWQKASEVARNLGQNVTQKLQSVAETVVADAVTATKQGPTSEPSQGRV